MNTKRLPFLLILLSYPLSLLLTVLLTLVEAGLARLVSGTILLELYPMVSRPAGVLFFFLSLNLIAVLWFFRQRTP